MSDEIKVNLILLAIAFGILFLWINIRKSHDIAEYNNGVCKVCGGHYEYQQAVGHYYFTDYIYKCDKCGNVIEVGSIMERR